MKRRKKKALIFIGAVCIIVIGTVTYNYLKSPDQQLGYEYISIDNILEEYYSYVANSDPIYYRDINNEKIMGYTDAGTIYGNLIYPETEEEGTENHIMVTINGNTNEELYTNAYLKEYASYDSEEREISVRGMKTVLKTITTDGNYETIGYFESEDAFYFIRLTNHGLEYTLESFNRFADNLIEKL